MERPSVPLCAYCNGRHADGPLYDVCPRAQRERKKNPFRIAVRIPRDLFAPMCGGLVPHDRGS